jgi:uncharacterized integral membrane protein (TIGR00697 family)
VEKLGAQNGGRYTKAMQDQGGAIPRSLFVFALLYGGLAVLAGVLGTKLASLGHWPILGDLAVESGIFAFLLLVVLASAVAEQHGQAMANRLIRFGFIPLIVSMVLLTFVIHVVPPAPFWGDQDAFARLLGQGARMQFAGLISYGTSQTLNVAIFSRMAGGQGNFLLLRAWIASMLSQVVDTILFISISFYGVVDQVSGKAMPIVAIMEGQIISKLVLSTIMVPPFIYLFVRLGRRLDRG